MDVSIQALDLPFYRWEWEVKSGHVVFSPPATPFLRDYLDPSAGPGWEQLIPAESVETFCQHWITALRKTDRAHLRVEFSDAPGPAILLLFHAIGAEKDEEGDLLRVTGLLRPDPFPPESGDPSPAGDLEERRRLETLLLRAQRFEGIGKLAGGLAHDINNLLAPIRMSAELLERKLKDPDLAYYVDIIQTSADRARGVFSRISQFSRSAEEANPQWIQVGEVLEDLERIVRETFPPRIEIEFSCAEDLPAVRIDPNHLHQAVLNLLLNARDSIKNTGGIGIKAFPRTFHSGAKVGTKSLPAGECIGIEIVDTGEGIEPEILDNVFDPFFTTKPKEEGSGLGLAMVYGIVTNARGFVDLDSTPGRGSSFTLYFPVTREGASLKEAGTDDLSANFEGMTVIVVDDEANLLETLTQTFQMWKMKVHPFHSSVEALETIRCEKLAADFVVVDLHLPLVAGDGFIRALQALRCGQHFILITGDVEANLSIYQQRLGLAATLEKPFKQNELKRVFHNCLHPSPPA